MKRFIPLLGYLVLIPLLGLMTGCKQLGLDKHHTSLGGGLNNAPIVTDGIVLAMGQSNMVGLPNQSPAIGFATATGITVVNCAVIGSTISEWSLGGALDSACLNAVSGKRVSGILWYQGENDAKLGTTNWDQSFIALGRGWRSRWGDIPIVLAQLATYQSGFGWETTWDTIKLQQASLGLSRSITVRTDDLPLRDDVHLTGDAYMEVGRRMAQAFNSLR